MSGIQISLAEKKALVTGGGKGIGWAICKKFLEAGADVAYISRSASENHAQLEELAQAQNTVIKAYQGDVSKQDQVDQILKQLAEDFGFIDILVNNAGITRDGLFFAMKADHWQEVLDVNLSSAFYVTKPLSRQMALKKTGSIINMSSVVGLIGNAGQANYVASKAGLIGFTKSIACELASRNVRVNAIAPGFIATPMTEGLNEKQKEAALGQIPMGRMGAPEEIAAIALFLASDLSSYITGQVLSVDGGMAR